MNVKQHLKFISCIYAGTWVFIRRCRLRRQSLYLALCTSSRCWRRHQVICAAGYLDWFFSSWTYAGATRSRCRVWGSARGSAWANVSFSFSTRDGTVVPSLLLLLQLRLRTLRQLKEITSLHQLTLSSSEVSIIGHVHKIKVDRPLTRDTLNAP